MNYLFLTVGVFIGTIVTRLFMKWHTCDAVFRIDHSNPEKDIYRLDFKDVDIDKKKWMCLRIDHNADLSQR